MKILITGAAGFIGSHLATRLLDEGHEVVGIDNLSAGVIENVDPRMSFHQLDIRAIEIRPLFAGVDAAFHLAAKNCLPDCLADPIETADINVKGTVGFLEAARLAGVKKVVYSDTSAEYEGVPELPSRVDRIAPESMYAVSKRSAALFFEAYQRFFGINYTAVRYFNVYGPAQDFRRTVPPLMSGIIMRLLRGERPVIYGSGEKRRDFIYVNDVTAFNVLALTDPRTNGQVFNVGTGVNHSVKDIFREIEVLMRTGLEPVYEADLPGEAESTLADISASRALGWKPEITLTEGLRRSIAYIKDHVLTPR